MHQTTAQQHAAILARDAMERAGEQSTVVETIHHTVVVAGREGPAVTFKYSDRPDYTVVSTPRG